MFATRFALAERYAGLLVTDGVLRGLIGPAEPGRIWTRHLLNCAAITELFPRDARVVDVGSGAGLPGLAAAIRRPDLRVDLVEPLARRTTFLSDVVGLLGLDEQVRVVRGRAEDPAVRAEVGGADWLTARAVAPLDRLVRWCLPLLGRHGRLALIKGASAAAEVDKHEQQLSDSVADLRVVRCGVDVLDSPTTVITARRAGPAQRQRR
jgi:16S rRNA (guanine527-N7)-methyltransferase